MVTPLRSQIRTVRAIQQRHTGKTAGRCGSVRSYCHNKRTVKAFTEKFTNHWHVPLF